MNEAAIEAGLTAEAAFKLKDEAQFTFADDIDIVAIQDKKLLKQDKRIEFLNSLQPHIKHTFGKKNKQRSEEPSMTELLQGGYDAYIKNDYTKNTAELNNKIKKMKREYISEAHDNYRRPEQMPRDDEDEDQNATILRNVNERILFNYFDLDENDMLKKKIFSDNQIDEREKRNQTVHGEEFGTKRHGKEDFLRQKNEEIKYLTPAGVPSFDFRPKRGLKTPMELQWQRIEAKLRELGFTKENLEAANLAYQEERAMMANASRDQFDQSTRS